MELKHAIYDIEKNCIVSYYETAKEADKKMRELRSLYKKLNLKINLKFKLINLDKITFNILSYEKCI
jgi:hypothetical protein